jgi:hypothetical protein
MARRRETITAAIPIAMAQAPCKTTGFTNSSGKRGQWKIGHSRLSSSIRDYRHSRLPLADLYAHLAELDSFPKKTEVCAYFTIIGLS